MITPIFLGKVENNSLQLENPKSYRDYLYTLKGKKVEVIIRLPKKDRSNPQNRYYWGVVIKLLCETTGYSDDEMHNALRMIFLRDTDRQIPTLKSTTTLSTVEFEEYLENIRMWAATQLDCVIPEPNQVEA